MIKQYTACESSVGKILPRAILSMIMGLGLIAIGAIISDLVWWSRILIGIVGFLLGIQGYYDAKYIRGFKKYGFIVNEEDKSIAYYNEFEGNKTVYPKDCSALKVYKKNREIYLLELFYKNSKKQENINVSGLYPDDTNEFIGYIKSFNPQIQVSKNC